MFKLSFHSKLVTKKPVALTDLVVKVVVVVAFDDDIFVV